MRFEGTLKQWDDDRGFGYIAARQGGDPVFVHISAFARGGPRPRVGEALTFEVEPTADGRKRASNVQRAAAPASRKEGDRDLVRPKRTGRRSVTGARVVPALVVAALAAFGYSQYAGRVKAGADAAMPASGVYGSAPAATAFRCDGRKHCSQMTSCEEATFFLRNCPGTQMDGDGDGIPCEQQWCRR